MSTDNPSPRASRGLITLALSLACLLCIGLELFHWTFNRVYVPQGSSLRIRYMGPPLPFLPGGKPFAKSGQFAQVDAHGNPLEIGILKEMRGPGRHFFWTGWWDVKVVPDTTIKPGELAQIKSNMGNDLKDGQFLVDGELGETLEKGTLRKVFGPGTYRINPYAYEVTVIKEETVVSGKQVKHNGWVSIPTGYVGVVTNLTDNKNTGAKAGIQDNVLQPGLYPVNPKEQEIDIIGVGYTEKSLKSNLVSRDGIPVLDDSGEPTVMDDDSGITFPSSDGFKIHMDFTAVWGIMPDQAPDVIRKFGNLEAVEAKVVIPQIESICRNKGSSLGAVGMLVGETRRKFQDDASDSFQKILKEKDLTLLHGFVRNIHIPQEVRKPIQESFLADELKLTRDQEQLTAHTEGQLREAEKTVELEQERIKAETLKVVAEAVAEGNKLAEETKAETAKKVAKVDRETAEIDAKATVNLGKAKASIKQMEAEAKSELFKLAVDAFGSGKAYNQWVFATGLPDNVQLDLFYAGEGTLWTDLKGFSDAMLAREAQQPSRPASTTRPAK